MRPSPAPSVTPGACTVSGQALSVVGLARVGVGWRSPRRPHGPASTAAPGASGGFFPTAHTSPTKNTTKIILHSTVKSLSFTT